MKALKVFSSNKNLKTILTFSAGVFSSLFVVIAITAFSDSYASKTTINDLPKVSFPIYVNNLKTDLESYVVNGRTYVSLSELSKYTILTFTGGQKITPLKFLTILS